jgi:hypothetical protein|tara:strand:- start:611 stop:1528 length:918 start_codon:yes stop_codon:yes gene_type:complete
MKKVRFLQFQIAKDQNNYQNYADMPKDVFLKTFLPQDCSYCIVNTEEKADICCFGLGVKDDSVLREDELNVFISVENTRHWSARKYNNESWHNPHYYFFNKYGYFGSKKTDIFIHNDKSEIISTSTYKCIPAIHCRTQYYNNMETYYKKLIPKIPFEKKKFILFISKNILNKNKQGLMEILVNKGYEVHHISMYNNIIKNKSCYHSIELLKIFSQYKFIAAFENSQTDGYITEKIFNVFFANSIPIYDGANNISEYINPKSYIRLDKNIINNINKVTNKDIYDKIINTNKIQEKYNNIQISFDKL